MSDKGYVEKIIDDLTSNQRELKAKFYGHRHCVRCGKTFFSNNPNQVTCGPDCAAAIQATRKKERRMMIFMFVPFIILLIVFLIMSRLSPT